MGKLEDQAKQLDMIKRLEALDKCREATARKERARANASLPGDKEKYVIDYDSLEPSPSNRSPGQALDYLSHNIFLLHIPSLTIHSYR